jgi:hypothetical protein
MVDIIMAELDDGPFCRGVLEPYKYSVLFIGSIPWSLGYTCSRARDSAANRCYSFSLDFGPSGSIKYPTGLALTSKSHVLWC